MIYIIIFYYKPGLLKTQEKKSNRQLVKQKISLEKYKLKVREQDGQGQLCI